MGDPCHAAGLDFEAYLERIPPRNRDSGLQVAHRQAIEDDRTFELDSLLAPVAHDGLPRRIEDFRRRPAGDEAIVGDQVEPLCLKKFGRFFDDVVVGYRPGPDRSFVVDSPLLLAFRQPAGTMDRTGLLRLGVGVPCIPQVPDRRRV